MRSRSAFQMLCRSTASTGVVFFLFNLLFLQQVSAQTTDRFNDGYLTTLRVTSAAALTGAGTQIVLDEYNPTTAGQTAPNYSVTMPSSGGTRVVIGGSTANGQFSRSEDGRLLVIPGYNNAIGDANTLFTSSGVVRFIEPSGTVLTGLSPSPALAYFTGNNNLRGATTDDGSNVWMVGQNTGVVHATTSAPNTATTVASTTVNNRYIFIQNGQLYFAGAAGTFPGVSSVGSGKPTASGTGSTRLFVPVSTSVLAAAMSPDGLTLYFVVDTGTPGLYRSTFNGTSWTTGTLIFTLSGANGVAVDWSNYAFSTTSANGARIYFTNNTTLNAVNDNGTTTATGTVLRTLTGNNQFRGVSFSPVRQTVSLGSSTPAASSLAAGVSNAALFQFNLASTEGNSALRRVVITNSGTATLGTGNDISNLRLIVDANNNGIADAGELSSTLGTPSINGSNIIFSNITATYVNQGSSTNYLLVGDVSAGASAGNTFIPAISSNLTINANTFTRNVVNAGQAPVRIGATAPNGNTLTISGATPNVAIASSHPAGGSINQGTTDALIGSISLAASASTASLTGFSITTSGTYVASDFTNFKIWIGPNSNNLTGATQLGANLASVASGGTLSVSSVSGTVPIGTTRYILITGTAAASATPGNTISLNTTAFTNIIFSSANKLGTDPVNAGNTFTIQLTPPSIALASSAIGTGTINQSATNAPIYSVAVTVTDNSTVLNAVSFATAGTYVVGDFAANGFKVWINTANNLTGATQLGSGQTVVASGGTISISGLSTSLPVGIRYIIVTADVAFNATAGNTINIAATPASSFVFSSGTITGVDPVPAGATQTIAAVTPSVAFARLAPTAGATINIPSTNVVLYQMSMAVTANTTNLNSLTFNTGAANTYNAASFVAGSVRLLYNTTNNFGTASQIGSGINMVSPGGALSFTGLNQNLTVGSTHFFWVVANPNNLGNNTTINIAAVASTNATFAASTNITGAPTAAGATLTLLNNPSMTELIMPQFAMTGGTTANRLPYIFRVRLDNLAPNATYRYITNPVGGTGGLMYAINNIDNPSSGNFITGVTSSKSLAGTLLGAATANENTGTARYAELTADASGSYTGWFCIVPTGASQFAAGGTFQVSLQLNNGGSGTTAAWTLNGTSSVNVLSTAAAAGGAQAVVLMTDAVAENIVLVYDNATGTGRPVSVNWSENDGIASGWSTWYSGNVESGNGRVGIVIPAVSFANGIRYIEQRSVANGAVVGCFASDADGVWTGAWGTTNTVNPAGGTTPIAIGNISPAAIGTVFTTPLWYQDSDGDTFGNPAVSLTSCTQPVGYVANNTDCDDNDAYKYPTADADGDGFTRCAGDCNDADASINPNAAEVCDGIDNNCNNQIDEVLPNWYVDGDGDGFGAGAIMFTQCANPGVGYASNNLDCNDANASITQIIWYQDADNDGYSNGNTLIQCAQPLGYKLASNLTATIGDCNDSDAAISPATLWYLDGDGDGFGNPTSSVASCTLPVGYVSNNQDCNDNNSAVRPTATEAACNGIDDNCNGTIDADAAGAILGCTDLSAVNYNASANCDNGTCAYAQTVVPGNLMVSRIVGTTSGASRLLLEEYNRTTAGAAVEFISLPTAGPSVLTTSGTATSEGQLTRSADGQYVVVAGYAAYAGTTSLANTFSFNVNRAIGSVDVNYNYTRNVLNGTFYNAQNIRSAARNGNNFWAAGVRNGITYFGGSSPADSVSNSLQLNNFRVIQDVGGKLFASTGNSNVTLGLRKGIYQIGTGLPTTNGQNLTPIITTASDNSSMYAFHFNKDETLCYIADDGAGGGAGGIQRWRKVSGTWTLDYNIVLVVLGNGVGATGVWVDYYGEATPAVFAITTNNRLVRFNDTGVLLPTLTTLATAPAGSNFRSVVLGPCTETAWYRDADGDGYGDPSQVFMYCFQPFGYVADNTDCDDTNVEVTPVTVWYRDLDNDGFSDGASLTQCLRPTNYKLTSELTATSGDCIDGDSAINPGASEVCNGIDDNCDTFIDDNTNAITITVNGNGTVNPATASAIPCGNNETFTFIPDACHEVSDVVVDGVSQGVISSYGFVNITEPHTVEVTYVRTQYSVTVTSSGNGGFTGPSQIACGSNGNILINADDCHYITSLTLNGTTILDGSELAGGFNLALTNVQANQTVNVTFAIRQFTLTSSIPAVEGTSASITPVGTITRNCGDDQSYTITTDECTEILNVIVNGISQGAVSTFTISNIRQNQFIFVAVARKAFTITTSAGAGGAITPGGTQVVSCGENATFNIVPQSNFGIVSVLVNGVEQGQIGSYTFTNLQANATISATFSPQPNNNSWGSSVPQVVPNFPNCLTTSGTLAGCTPSPEASYYPAPVGAGQDAWFRFKVPDLSTGTVRIAANSSVNNLAIILQKEESFAPFYSAVAQENALSSVGGEVMTVSGLIPGAFYRVGIKNMSAAQAPGAYNVCVTNVRQTGCGFGMTTPRSLCDFFLGAYTGAQSYTFTFTNTSNPTEVFTRTNTGASGGPASSLVTLSSLLGLRYGTSYDVRIDATYQFTNSAGTTSTVTIPGAPVACQLTTIAQPTTDLALADQCASSTKIKSSVISTAWVCGVIDYRWEVRPTIGLPVIYETFRGLGERFMRVGTLNGINTGGTQFDIRVTPIFSDGAGGRRTGTPGNWQSLCLVAPIGMAENKQEADLLDVAEKKMMVDNGVSAEVYPNPNTGETFTVQLQGWNGQVQVHVMELTGREVMRTVYTVDGALTTEVTPSAKMASGVYMIRFTQGDRTITRRMIVSE